MATITIELPDDACASLQCSHEEVARDMREAAAALWYDERRVSQGIGAALAGVDRLEFYKCLARSKVDFFQITPEELRAEVEYARNAYRERLAARG